MNGFLETSVPGIFAAGDIARWPDPHSGGNIRVEHWVVAERQGQTAALNMLGRSEKFTAVPFFWSQHYDVRINYVGHAERWDEVMVEGDIAGRDCLLRLKCDGRVLAAASISREIENLMAEVAMEHEMVARYRACRGGTSPFPEQALLTLGVRRAKAALSSGCKSHPATAPAGSNRSRHGGDEMSEAFD